jgi:hypothetical protein
MLHSRFTEGPSFYLSLTPNVTRQCVQALGVKWKDAVITGVISPEIGNIHGMLHLPLLAFACLMFAPQRLLYPVSD